MSVVRRLGTMILPLALAGSVLAASPPDASSGTRLRIIDADETPSASFQGAWQRSAAPRLVGRRTPAEPIVPVRPSDPLNVHGGLVAMPVVEDSPRGIAPRGLIGVSATDDDTTLITGRLLQTQGGKLMSIPAEGVVVAPTDHVRRRAVDGDRRHTARTQPVVPEGVSP